MIRWIRNGVLRLVGLVIALGVIGALYQFIGNAVDQHRYPPLGELVDVGGYRLHLYCTGVGSPTVALGSMSPGWSLYWSTVQPEIAKLTRVCSYDRAGYGWSDPGPAPRTAKQDAMELHALLTKGQISGPYVLVGHSFSGFTVRIFQHQYPSEVAGIVLVDAGSEDFEHHPEMMKATAEFTRQLPVLRAAAILGIVRLAANFETKSFIGEKQFHEVPLELQPLALAGWTRSTYVTTFAQEIEAQPETREAARASGTLGDLPLMVITATGPVMYPNMPVRVDEALFKKEWLELQQKLTMLSTHSSQLFADKSSHYVPFDQPEVVIAGARQLVDTVRAARK